MHLCSFLLFQLFFNFCEFFFVRVANMIKMSTLTLDEIWKIAKKIKSEVSLDKLCPNKQSFYNRQKPYPVLSAIEQHLGIEPSEIIYENMTTEILEIAAPMFIYLIGCPAQDALDTKQWYTSWNTFYSNLFSAKSPQQIILTLNRITKSKSSEDKDGKTRAAKLLKRTKSIISLKYETIEKLMPGTKVRGTLREFHDTTDAFPVELEGYFLSSAHLKTDFHSLCRFCHYQSSCSYY